MSEPVSREDELEIQTQLLQYRASLYDPDTGLPSLPAVLDEVRRLLGEQGAVQVLVVQIEQERNLESIIGWERYDRLLRFVADYLREALAGSHGSDAILCQMQVRCDRFLVFLSDRRQTSRMLEVLSDPMEIEAEDDSDDSLTVGVRVGHGEAGRGAGSVPVAGAPFDSSRAPRDHGLSADHPLAPTNGGWLRGPVQGPGRELS